MNVIRPHDPLEANADAYPGPATGFAGSDEAEGFRAATDSTRNRCSISTIE